MGYTHYWTIKQDLDTPDDNGNIKWHQFVKEAKQILEKFELTHPATLANGLGDKLGDYICDTDKGIIFNGYQDLSHETFLFTHEQVEFEFCKTAQKPYDIAVTAILLLAKDLFGGSVSLKSDGYVYEWEDGKNLFAIALGRQPIIALDNHESVR